VIDEGLECMAAASSTGSLTILESVKCKGIYYLGRLSLRRNKKRDSFEKKDK